MTEKDYTKLWILTNNTVRGYDTYDQMCVAADTKEESVLIHPERDNNWVSNEWGRRTWCSTPEDVIVEEIGVTHGHRRGSIILSSFNAG